MGKFSNCHLYLLSKCPFVSLEMSVTDFKNTVIKLLIIFPTQCFSLIFLIFCNLYSPSYNVCSTVFFFITIVFFNNYVSDWIFATLCTKTHAKTHFVLDCRTLTFCHSAKLFLILEIKSLGILRQFWYSTGRSWIWYGIFWTLGFQLWLPWCS